MANAIPVHGNKTTVGDNEVFAELEKNAPKRKTPKRQAAVKEFDNEAAAAEELEFANDPQEFQKIDDQPRRPSGALLGEMLDTGRRRGVPKELPVRKHMEGKTTRVDW